MAQGRGCDGEPVRVLVVDSDPILRRLIRNAVGGCFVVEERDDGLDALERYLEGPLDIMVVGERPGRCPVHQVVGYIRDQANDQRLFILVLFWDLSPSQEFDLLHAGANDCLRLPFHREIFRARMEVALRHIRMTQQLEAAFQRIESQIRTVSELQKKLVPASGLEVPGFRIRHLYEPSGLASGDYYDWMVLPSGEVRVVVADVSGHGARAAFVMAMVRAVVRAASGRGADIESVLTISNTQLLETVGDEPDFVTIFLADIDACRQRLRFANAGHCPGLVRIGGTVQPLGGTTPMLGFFPLEFSAQELPFPPGSGLLLYTDGLYEWEVDVGKQLGVDRFVELAEGVIRQHPVFLDDLMRRLESVGQMAPVFADDLTLLWVETDGDWRSATLRSQSAPTQVRAMVREAVALAQLPEDLARQVELGLVEACANVVRHAYGETGGLVEIRVAVLPGRMVRFQVVDWGQPFDPPERWGLPENQSSSGRGLFLIHTLMDRVHYGRWEGANVVTVEKHWEDICRS